MRVVWTPITVQSKHWMVAGGICISVSAGTTSQRLAGLDF